MKQQLSILYNGKQSASFPAPPPQRLGEAWDATTAVYFVQWETVTQPLPLKGWGRHGMKQQLSILYNGKQSPSPSPSKAGGGMG